MLPEIFCLCIEGPQGKDPSVLPRSVLLSTHPSCHIFWDHFQGSKEMAVIYAI